MEFLAAIQPFVGQPLTRHVLLNLLQEYKRPNDKLNDLVNQGMLVRVKRDIYIPGPKLPVAQPEPFLLANHLTGPSYVSLESVLSHENLIPEKVYEISSITNGPSKTFKTPVGRFTYRHMPLPYYSFGIRQLELASKQNVLVATKEKALCDKIVTTSGLLLRSMKQVMDFLTEDLRIEKQNLGLMDITLIKSWVKQAPKRQSLQMLIKTLNAL